MLGWRTGLGCAHRCCWARRRRSCSACSSRRSSPAASRAPSSAFADRAAACATLRTPSVCTSGQAGSYHATLAPTMQGRRQRHLVHAIIMCIYMSQLISFRLQVTCPAPTAAIGSVYPSKIELLGGIVHTNVTGNLRSIGATRATMRCMAHKKCTSMQRVM